MRREAVENGSDANCAEGFELVDRLVQLLDELRRVLAVGGIVLAIRDSRFFETGSNVARELSTSGRDILIEFVEGFADVLHDGAKSGPLAGVDTATETLIACKEAMRRKEGSAARREKFETLRERKKAGG